VDAFASLIAEVRSAGVAVIGAVRTSRLSQTLRRAAIAGNGIAVVALLAVTRIRYPVAAPRILAACATRIGSGIGIVWPVVALFVTLDDAVTAELDLTKRTASIAVGNIAVVTLFVGLFNAVAALSARFQDGRP
jgi:hypothetical protein